MKKRLLTAALAALSLGQTFAAERNPAVRPVMDWGRLTRGLSTLCMEESTRAPEPLAFPQRQLPTLTDAGIRDALQFLSTPLQTLVISFVEDEVF